MDCGEPKESVVPHEGLGQGLHEGEHQYALMKGTSVPCPHEEARDFMKGDISAVFSCRGTSVPCPHEGGHQYHVLMKVPGHQYHAPMKVDISTMSP